MKPVEAAVIIQKLQQQSNQQCALTPEDWQGTGLVPKRVLRKEDGNILFYYVDRLELIELLRKSHNLHPKQANICRILNS